MPRSLVALLLVAAPGLAVSAADTEPTKFVSKEGKFKATFPGKVESKNAKTKAGAAYLTATCEPRPGVIFRIDSTPLAREIPADKVDEFFKDATTGIKGKTISKEKVTVGKNKLMGYEVIFDFDGLYLRMLVVLDGKQLYQVGVSGPAKKDVTSVEADNFIDSFDVVR